MYNLQIKQISVKSPKTQLGTRLKDFLESSALYLFLDQMFETVKFSLKRDVVWSTASLSLGLCVDIKTFKFTSVLKKRFQTKYSKV